MSRKNKKQYASNYSADRVNGFPSDGGVVVLDAPPKLLRLDLGCGSNKREGFQGVDSIDFPGVVDFVTDLRQPWPWPDNSVEEAHSSHFIEHLGAWERVHFWNELYRVLIPDGKATIIVPHCFSERAYGDPSHVWPPFGTWAFYYLSRAWRLGDPEKGIKPNAPHTDSTYIPNGFNCDFEAVWGYSSHPLLNNRNQEHVQFAWIWYKEAIQDVHATLTAKKG